jgi:nitrogen fixation protein FixH
MLWVAVRTHPDLVRSDYYEASKGVDGEQATRLASAHLGWRVAPLAEGRDVVLLRIADVEGRPVTGLTGEARAYRPADASLDQALPLGADATEPGLYRMRFARPAPGLWRLTLDVRRDGARFVHELPLVAP